MTVQDHVMSKLIEPILAVEPRGIDVIEMDDVICDFMVLLCIYKYAGVNNAWQLHFGMGEVHNTF